MWIINEIKKDIINIGGVIAGIFILMYLAIGRLDLYFFQYALRITIAVLCVGSIMLVKNNIGKSTNNMFKFLAIAYRYIGIALAVILIARDQYALYSSEQYIKMRLGIELFEIIAIYVSYAYLKREFNQVKVYCLSFLFFISIMYSVLTPHFFQYSTHDFMILAYVIEALMLGSIIGLFCLNYCLIGKFNKQVVFRMYLFLGLKGLYQLTNIIYLYNDTYIIGLTLILLRLIYTYHLIACLFNERVSLPWKELLHKVKMTDEKLTDNAKDRHDIINLSHELKTPIHVIQSAVDVLNLDSTKELDGEFVMGLKKIKKNCYQSTNLITNIIDNNKLEEGYIHPKYVDCNLIPILDNIIIALAEYNSKWSIHFNPQQEEVYVYIDEELIQRCLLNLIALLIRHQTKEDAISIQIQILSERVNVTITSETTRLPLDYINVAEDTYSKENINELAALEFVKKVLMLYGTPLHLISNEEQGTTIYIHLNLSKLPDRGTIHLMDYEENINALLSKIKVQYADV